jgi:hypothetical protein
MDTIGLASLDEHLKVVPFRGWFYWCWQRPTNLELFLQPVKSTSARLPAIAEAPTHYEKPHILWYKTFLIDYRCQIAC